MDGANMSAAKSDTAQTAKPAFLKVRATEPGYFGDGPKGAVYQHAGDVFTIRPREIPALNRQTGKPELDASGRLKTAIMTIDEQFAPEWMEAVDANEPERLTTAKDEMARQIEELNSRGSLAEPT